MLPILMTGKTATRRTALLHDRRVSEAGIRTLPDDAGAIRIRFKGFSAGTTGQCALMGWFRIQAGRLPSS
jgi:hypothetical protein